MIIEPGKDLDVDEGGQPVVGEVGLPRLVGLLGLEADVGRTGPLLRGRHDETLSAQRPIDRRVGAFAICVTDTAVDGGNGDTNRTTGGQTACDERSAA